MRKTISVDDGTTDLLRSWHKIAPAQRDRFVEHLYPQLRRLVGGHRNRRPGEITLQTTDLVHELYLRLLRQRSVRWEDRAHFFAIAGRLLRRIAVDHERHRRRRKRGSGQMEPSLEQAAVDVPAETPLELADLVTLNQALVELEAIDDRAARVVELRFFAGMSHDEAAAALGIGRATVARRWRFARAWLRNRLENAPRAPTS